MFLGFVWVPLSVAGGITIYPNLCHSHTNICVISSQNRNFSAIQGCDRDIRFKCQVLAIYSYLFNQFVVFTGLIHGF